MTQSINPPTYLTDILTYGLILPMATSSYFPNHLTPPDGTARIPMDFNCLIHMVVLSLQLVNMSETLRWMDLDLRKSIWIPRSWQYDRSSTEPSARCQTIGNTFVAPVLCRPFGISSREGPSLPSEMIYQHDTTQRDLIPMAVGPTSGPEARST